MAAAVRLGLPRDKAFSSVGSTAGLAENTSSLAASEWLMMQLNTPAAGVMSPTTLLAKHLAVICKRVHKLKSHLQNTCRIGMKHIADRSQAPLCCCACWC